MRTWRNMGAAHNGLGLWYQVESDDGDVIEVARGESADNLVAILNALEAKAITLHDRCTSEGCGRVLHSAREAKSGKCSSCWLKAMPADTKAAMNKLIGAAFTQTPKTDAEKDKLIDDAIRKLKRDDGQD